MAQVYKQNLRDRLIGELVSRTPTPQTIARFTAMCAVSSAVVLTSIPSESQGGVMNFRKSIVSLSSTVNQIHYHGHRYAHSQDVERSRAARAFVARELKWDRAFYGSPYYGYSYGWGNPCYDYSWSNFCNRFRWSYPPY
jgi:hypothetical protein